MQPTQNENIRIYLDNCCFNRPFDGQQLIKIRLETEAKLHIQTQVLGKKLQLVWSYMLDYENAANPYPERRHAIADWRKHATLDIDPSHNLVEYAEQVQTVGIKPKDALHIACAVEGECSYFVTTDKGILNKAEKVTGICILSPVRCIDYLEREL